MNKLVFVAVACLVAVVVAAPIKAPTRPQIPSTFIAGAEIELVSGDHKKATARGRGRFANDERLNSAVENFELEHDSKTEHFLSLQRFDLHEEFTLRSEDRHDCEKHNLTGDLPPAFGWVSQAKFVGQKQVHSRTIDFWEARFGGVRLGVGVDQTNPNVPVTLERESATEMVRYFFEEFNATAPPADVFEVPAECRQQQQRAFHSRPHLLSLKLHGQ